MLRIENRQRGAAVGDAMPDKVPVPAGPAKGARLLTVRQAAAYLGTTPATLYTKVWRREIPFIKLGRSVRFDVNDLDQLIADSRVESS
jgi:excisionase family DNA binding protein